MDLESDFVFDEITNVAYPLFLKKIGVENKWLREL